jgi:hypothetical protein
MESKAVGTPIDDTWQRPSDELTDFVSRVSLSISWAPSVCYVQQGCQKFAGCPSRTNRTMEETTLIGNGHRVIVRTGKLPSMIHDLVHCILSSIP